jgi:histidyl-tRNA synthetase
MTEIEEVNEKLDVIKESFEEIMEMLQELDIKQKAMSDLLVVRGLADEGDIDFIADAIKENM